MFMSKLKTAESEQLVRHARSSCVVVVVGAFYKCDVHPRLCRVTRLGLKLSLRGHETQKPEVGSVVCVKPKFS